MPNADPIQMIRRSLKKSAENLHSVLRPDSKFHNKRSLRFESLEERRVLSATGLVDSDALHSDTGLVATQSYGDSDAVQSSEIVELLVEVNGSQRLLTPSDNLLELVAGDQVNVVEINFNSTANQGVFAAEGYVNKINDLSSASLIDYNDGRFSERSANAEATGGEGSVGGLMEGWTVESGWDRMTINLMHYTESSTDVASRFFVQMQVGQPDFEFDIEALEQIKNQEIQVGNEVSIPARWFNGLEGRFHNYAEVDIYHSSDMETIVWAGAVVGNTDESSSVEGEFLNTRTDDSFSKHWTPELEGEYVLKYYLDPEAVAAESNEANNEHEIRLTVDSAAPPEAVDDHFDSHAESLDVLANDLPNQADEELKVAEFTQPEHGKVSLNEDGTLQYTPEDDFTGVDKFTYTATDGDQDSNEASVTIDVTKRFDVTSSLTGLEDTPIKLQIESDYDAVLVSGLPKDAELNFGKSAGKGSYRVNQDNLAGLELTPPPQSDADFQLTVTPVDGKSKLKDLSQTIDIEVKPVVDGGRVHFQDFGIVTGSSGKMPLEARFPDLDGSESHRIVVTGLPDFLSLSKGDQEDSHWNLKVDDLKSLKVSSEKVADVSGWTEYHDKYVYKPFEVAFDVESVEADGGEFVKFSGTFKIYVWQKLK